VKFFLSHINSSLITRRFSRERSMIDGRLRSIEIQRERDRSKIDLTIASSNRSLSIRCGILFVFFCCARFRAEWTASIEPDETALRGLPLRIRMSRLFTGASGTYRSSSHSSTQVHRIKVLNGKRFELIASSVRLTRGSIAQVTATHLIPFIAEISLRSRALFLLLLNGTLFLKPEMLYKSKPVPRICSDRSYSSPR